MTAAKGTKRAYSINNLEHYAPFMCCYSALVFISWMSFWVLYKPSNICYSVEICPAYKGPNPNRDDIFWSKLAAAAFGLSSTLQILYILTSDIVSTHKVPIYCSICVNTIASLSHIAMALDVSPVLISPFGRVSHAARFGEWIALVPLLVVMIHSLDIRDEYDTKLLFISSFFQQISVLLGGIASVITNYNLSITLIILSFLFYSLIFIDMIRATQRLNAYRILKQKEDSDIDKKINKEGIIKSFYLTLSCCMCWTFVVIVYSLGILNTISHELEFFLQSFGDVVIKLFYVYILSMGQISVMNEEKLLNAIHEIGNFFGRMKYMTSRG